MTITDEIKNFDDNIKINQAKHNLNREAAKISALSFKELDKYEYLVGEDFGYNLGVVEQSNLNILHWLKFLIKD